MEVQNRLRELRAIVFKGAVSQKELAERAGIDPSTLSDIEKNRTNPSIESAFSLARELGVSVEDLFVPSVPTDADGGSRPTDHATGGAGPSGANGPSTAPAGEAPAAAVVEPRSQVDRTAADPAPAKESDGDLAGAR